MRLRIATLARLDMDEIQDFIARDKPAAARRWIAKTRVQFSLLVKNPEIGELRSELGENIRSISHGSYVIYFRQSEDILEILRVLRGSRDIQSLL